MRLFIHAAIAAIFAAVLLAGPTTTADAQERLRLAHFSPTTSPNHATAQALAERIEAATDGRYTIEIFENSQLGGEVEVVEAIGIGTVDISLPSAASLANVIAEMNILNMPFMFRSWDHYAAALESEFFDAMSEKAAQRGYRFLGFTTSGARHIMTKFPVNSIDDLEGRKIRTVQNPVHVATFAAFGANPTAISYPEVYGALQTGVVEGGDAANTNYNDQKFYEVAPHWALLGWLYYTNAIVMSEAKFQSMSETDQKALLSIGAEVGRQHIDAWRKSDADLLGVLKDNGVMVTEPPREPFEAAVGSVYEEFLKSDFERDWLQKIREVN